MRRRIARLPVVLGICVTVCIGFGAASARGESPRELLEQARAAAADDESEEAVRLLTAAIEGDARLAPAYYLRGREQFRLGRLEAAVADFDRYVELQPDAKSRQWERGIALYYAGRHKDGAQQFELYQTYHDSDVENSVWRFLCMAKTDGVEQARKAMLPIKNDRRPGMMEVFELYRGKLSPEDVLAAAREGEPPADVLYARMFYMHLYVGLLHDALGNDEQAGEHIDKAVEHDRRVAGINRYMWDVARIHQQQRKKK